MAIRQAQQLIGRLFTQRCFYLFIVLLAFDALAPFIPTDPLGRITIYTLDCLVVVAAVAAVGRTALSFVIVCLLAFGAVVFLWLSINHEDPTHLVRSWGFSAALELATIIYLLHYVFQPEVMTADKLFGAAAAYLLIGSFWATLYALTDLFYPGSFPGVGGPDNADLSGYVYFSFTVLTSTGFGDIVPKTRQARALCNLEQVIGALYLAILIARLAGVYPPMPRRGRRTEPE